MMEAFQSSALRQMLVDLAGKRKQLETVGDKKRELWDALRKSEVDVANLAIRLMRERLAEITVSKIESKLQEHNVSKEIIKSITVVKTDTGVVVGANADSEELRDIDPIIKSIITDAGKEARSEVLKEITGVGFDLCIGKIYSELIGIVPIGTLQEFRGLFDLKHEGMLFYLKPNFSEEFKSNEEVAKITDRAYSEILENYFKPILGLVLQNSSELRYNSQIEESREDGGF